MAESLQRNGHFLHQLPRNASDNIGGRIGHRQRWRRQVFGKTNEIGVGKRERRTANVVNSSD